MPKNLFIICILLLSVQTAFSQEQKLKQVDFLPLWVPQPQFAGYYMAKEKGLYEKYGLDVNIIHGGYKKDVPEYLKSGKADFGIMYLASAIKERVGGTKLVNVGQIFQRSEIMFVAKKSSGIKSLTDFNGKKISVWRTVLNDLTEGFLKKHNIDAEVIRINEGVNIFLKGGVDICAVMYYNEYNELINFGINPEELEVFYFRDYGMNFPEDGIYCMEETYEKDPEMCRDFMKASLEGWEYAISHPEETLETLRRYQQLQTVRCNSTHSLWMLNAMKDLINPAGGNTSKGELLETDYNITLQFLLENGVVTSSEEFSIFYRGIKKDE